MTSWADVAGKAMDLLKKPSGLSVFLIMILLLFIAWFVPPTVSIYYARQNTEDLKTAILSLKDCMERSRITER